MITFKSLVKMRSDMRKDNWRDLVDADFVRELFPHASEKTIGFSVPKHVESWLQKPDWREWLHFGHIADLLSDAEDALLAVTETKEA